EPSRGPRRSRSSRPASRSAPGSRCTPRAAPCGCWRGRMSCGASRFRLRRSHSSSASAPCRCRRTFAARPIHSTASATRASLRAPESAALPAGGELAPGKHRTESALAPGKHRTESALAPGKHRTESALAPWTGDTRLYITPGFHFRVSDVLLTNFHLPESTLLILVCAFAGRHRTLAAYEHAVRARYRFFSYGDAMLITRGSA